MVSSKVILALALVCVALVPAHAVTKCFTCTHTPTAEDINCLYGNGTSVTCGTAAGFSHCFKRFKEEGTEKEEVSRGCGNETGFQCGTGFECLFCEDDDCNSSVTISLSLPVIGLSLVGAYLLSRFNH